MNGWVRVVRGTAAGTLATAFALLFHLAAGGQMPGRLGVVVPLVLSVFVGVTISPRRLSAVSLTLSALISQYLFHWLFVLGVGPGSAQGPAQSHHGHQGHHAIDLSVSAVETDGGHGGHDHGGEWMWLAHVVAAVLTAVVLHRGEVLARQLGLWGHLMLRRLLRRVPRAAPVRACPRLVLRPERLDLGAQQWRPGVPPSRGPPPALVLAA